MCYIICMGYTGQQRRDYQNARHRRLREWVDSFKDRPCADCGIKYPPWVMDFDHRDESEKKFAISKTNHRAKSVLEAEINKCDVVCANCHRHRTHIKDSYDWRNSPRQSASARTGRRDLSDKQVEEGSIPSMPTIYRGPP